MQPVEVIGWAAALTGVTLGLPQLLRLARTRRVDGLSLTTWQAFLVINISWTAHGIGIGQVPQILTSALSLCSTAPILYLMARELRLDLRSVFLPCLLASAAMITIDRVFGSAVFGASMIIPAVVANAGQGVELLRSPRIVGVSGLFLFLSVVNQGLWLTWAILVPDMGTVIVCIATGAITVFNLVLWSLRTLGMRPLFVAPPPRESVQTAGSSTHDQHPLSRL